jgi:hypothetical protein
MARRIVKRSPGNWRLTCVLGRGQIALNNGHPRSRALEGPAGRARTQGPDLPAARRSRQGAHGPGMMRQVSSSIRDPPHRHEAHYYLAGVKLEHAVCLEGGDHTFRLGDRAEVMGCTRAYGWFTQASLETPYLRFLPRWWCGLLPRRPARSCGLRSPREGLRERGSERGSPREPCYRVPPPRERRHGHGLEVRDVPRGPSSRAEDELGFGEGVQALRRAVSSLSRLPDGGNRAELCEARGLADVGPPSRHRSGPDRGITKDRQGTHPGGAGPPRRERIVSTVISEATFQPTIVHLVASR